jgi:hypothetical protein
VLTRARARRPSPPRRGQRSSRRACTASATCWQVHVVELLRTFDFKQRGPVLAELKEDSWLRQWYTLPADTTSLRELRGMARGVRCLNAI